MKYCVHCGKELFDEAIICPGCGCATGSNNNTGANVHLGLPNIPPAHLLNQLSQKLKINAIIWIVIGSLQILGGIFLGWWMLIVGVLNIISACSDITYSGELLKNPTGIVKKFEPLTGPIITLVYNLIVGGFIGVIGSIYYFIAIRGFVMENKALFS